MFIAVRTTARIQAFIPGASPPDVKIAIFFMCLKILNKLIKCIFNKIKIEKLKKILLISYYWKNDNSVGKLRWYNLVKELKKLNYSKNDNLNFDCDYEQISRAIFNLIKNSIYLTQVMTFINYFPPKKNL